MKSKKGITPIIAVILLLMMTVAGAGAAFFWFVRIQSEMQGGTESYSEQLSEKISARMDISEMDYTGTDLKIVVRNNGNVPISVANSTTTFILKDYNNNIMCNARLNGTSVDDTNDVFCQSGCSGNVDIKSTKQLLLNFSNASSPCYINSSIYSSDTLFTVKMDFAGLAASGGQFST